MFNNPLNRKYQTGGSVEDEGFYSWLKSNVKEFKDYSIDQIKEGVRKMEQTEEGRKASASLKKSYKEYKRSKPSTKSKFADGGKMQSFICKHAYGGNVDCGCDGMVVKGRFGIDEIPVARDSTVTTNGVVLYPSNTIKAPDNTLVKVTYGHDKDGQWFRKEEDSNGVRILGGYKHNNKWIPDGDIVYGPGTYVYDDAIKSSNKASTKQRSVSHHVPKGADGLPRLSRRDALDTALAQNEDAPSMGTIRRTYRDLKREGLLNGLGWRARRDYARQNLIGNYIAPEQETEPVLTRRQAIAGAMQGLSNGDNRITRQQARIALANARLGLRNNTDLRGRELTQAARRMVGLPQQAPVPELQSFSIPTVEIPTVDMPNIEITEPDVDFDMSNNMINGVDLSHLGFNDAFRTARNSGLDSFFYNGQLKNTKLASELPITGTTTETTTETTNPRTIYTRRNSRNNDFWSTLFSNLSKPGSR